MQAPLVVQATGAGKGIINSITAREHHMAHAMAMNGPVCMLTFSILFQGCNAPDTYFAGFTASLTSTAAWAVADVARPAIPLARTGLVVSPIRPCKMPMQPVRIGYSMPSLTMCLLFMYASFAVGQPERWGKHGV